MQRELWQYNKARRIVQGNFYVQGRRTRRKLATFRECGLDDFGRPIAQGREAREHHDELLIGRYQQIEEGLGVERPIQAPAANSFKALFRERVDLLRRVRSKRTVEIAELTLARYLAAVGDHPMSECDLRKINIFTILLTDAGLGAATVNVYLKAAKTFLRWANEMGQLEKVPKIPLLRAPRSTLQCFQTARPRDSWGDLQP